MPCNVAARTSLCHFSQSSRG